MSTNQENLNIENLGEGFTSFYNGLKEKPSTTIRIFDRNDFYTVHNEDAKFAAKEYFKTTTVIKEYGRGAKSISSVALSKMNFENFVRELLLVRSYRVELYRSKGKNVNWELVARASPGNLQQFEEVLFKNNAMSQSSVVLSLKLSPIETGEHMIACAFTDISERVLHVGEYNDNDQYSNFEVLLMQVGARECLVSKQDIQNKNLKLVLDRSGVLVTECANADYNSSNILQDLNRLVIKGIETVSTLPELNLKIAMHCVSSLIKYLELLSDETMFGQLTIKTFDLTQYMHLDAAAVRALHLLPTALDGGNKTVSLYGLLNQCRTSQGQRLMAQWIKQPLLDIKKIEERLDIVEAILNDTLLLQELQDNALKKLPDISRLAKKFQAKKANLQDCVRVYQSIMQLPSIIDILNGHEGDHHVMIQEVFSKPLSDIVSDFKNYIEMIETTVDLSCVEMNEYVIKAEFDEGLRDCKENIDSVTSQFDGVLKKAARDLNLEAGKTIKLENSSQLGHYFRITLKEEKVLRNNKKFITLETRKDGVRFTNSSLKDLSEQFIGHRSLYNELQADLAKEVLNIAWGYVEPLLSFSSTIAYLDVLLSFAVVASQAPLQYVRPKIHDKGQGKLILKGSRHPCLEMQDGIGFIPNDIELIKGERELLIITGPNMGGKSTYIRQVSLVTLMSQIGCFVPCQSAEISIVDRILARVGAADSQLKGVSTFLSEMLETKTILQAATSDSLVIIDELGRGTSTYDGFGLAWSISEYIATSLHAFTLFATHFHELTSLSDEVSVVSNYHVSAITSNEQLTLLYKVKPGVCDQSFGIHVAEMVKFPEHVVSFAKRKARELEDFQKDEYEDFLKKNGKSLDEFDTKRRRIDKKEGEDMVNKVLTKLDAMNQNGATNNELVAHFLREIEVFKKSGNTFLSYVINKNQNS